MIYDSKNTYLPKNRKKINLEFKDMDDIYKAKINFIKPDVLASLVYKVAMNKGINDQIIKVGDNSVR